MIIIDNTELYTWNSLKEEFKFSQQNKIINMWRDEYGKFVCDFLHNAYIYIYILYSHITCFEYIARLVVTLTSVKLKNKIPHSKLYLEWALLTSSVKKCRYSMGYSSD